MSELLIEDRAGVRILTMNRPEKRNALNQALTQALLEALHATEADDGVRSIVLTGAGPAFCAGADLGGPVLLPPVHLRQLFVAVRVQVGDDEDDEVFQQPAPLAGRQVAGQREERFLAVHLAAVDVADGADIEGRGRI